MSSLHIQCRQYIVGTHLAHGHSVAVLLRPTRRHGPRLCDRLVSKPASTNRARPGIVPGAQSRRSPPPTQSDLDFPAQQILSALEVVAWFCATGLQLWAFSLAHQQYRKSQHCTLQEEAEYSAGEATPVAQATWSDHVSASPSLMTQFAVFAVILAAVFGRARSWLSHGRKKLPDEQGNTSASAQLVRLNALADRQAQSLTAVERQVTKLQLRTRLMGHDVKPLLKTVQHENLQQAEVLNNHNSQLEAMKTDIQDTQKLLSALQSVSAKQFDVLLKLVKQQQQQQQPKLKQVDKALALEQLEGVTPHQA